MAIIVVTVLAVRNSTKGWVAMGAKVAGARAERSAGFGGHRLCDLEQCAELKSSGSFKVNATHWASVDS